MDRRNRKHEITDKKTDNKIKDRGDLKKAESKKTSEENTVRKKIFADRGDSENKGTNQKLTRTRINLLERKRTNQDTNCKNISNATVGKEQRKEDVEKQALSSLDIRRMIKERDLLKQRHEVEGIDNNTQGFVKSNRTVNRSKNLLTEELQHKQNQKEIINHENSTKESTYRRKPINKPLISKNAPSLTLHKELTEILQHKEKPKESINLDVIIKNKDATVTKPINRTTASKNILFLPKYKQLSEVVHYREKPKESINTDVTSKKPGKESTKPRQPIIKNVSSKTGATLAIYKQSKETHYQEPKEHLNKDTTTRTLKESTITRKPIIKTVTSKNGPARAIYKAVTFGEQKTKPKPLQIKIPNDNRVYNDTQKVYAQKVSKSSDTFTLKPKTVSRVTVKEKSDIRKKIFRRRKRNKYASSPESFKLRENQSPPTEVAKWAPSCVSRHTKPYYEAWVNTTLAAISRSSKKDKMFLEKRNIIESFQKALEERDESSELVYERITDEKYTGKIRVIHK